VLHFINRVLFEDATRAEAGCILRNEWRDELFSPIDERHEPIQVGLLGTGSAEKLKNERSALARILASLDRPLIYSRHAKERLRRTGFLVAADDGLRAGFLRLPAVAPSIELLAWGRSAKPDWREFRKRYEAELPAGTVRVAAAFAESAATRGVLPVLICAERDAEDF
jgi:hypothetical protein